VFAFLLGGLNEFGVGADFAEGILQGGEGETIVKKSSKASFHIFLLAQGSIRAREKQLYVRMGARRSGCTLVQARDRTSTNWPKII